MLRKYMMCTVMAVGICFASACMAQFADDFENGVGNWEVSWWTGATFISDSNGNPGKAGYYSMGTNTGWIQVLPQPWTDAQLSGDYRFSADLKFKQNDMECVVLARGNSLWTMDFYGVSFTKTHQADWKINIYGPYAGVGPVFTASNVPAGFVFHNSPDEWNHVEVLVHGTRLEVTVNGTLLYKGKGHSSRKLTGRAAVRTGWFGKFEIDNAFVESTPLSGNCEDSILSGYGLKADINEDCYVDFTDFAYLVDRWALCIDPNVSECERVWE